MAYYFVADVHLGLSYRGGDPLERERLFTAWLERISGDAEGLFLVGDIFDFWFEYKRVVPKGFARTLGKLGELTDRGISVSFLVGNHDYWVGDYFRRELGMRVFLGPQVIDLQGKRVFVAHGDTLVKPGGWLGAFMRAGFHSRWLRRTAEVLVHPNQMMRFGKWWSSKSRHGRGGVALPFGGEREPLVQFARAYQQENQPVDYFVFGHIHTPTEYPLDDHTRVVVLGEWIQGAPVVGRMEGGVITLETL